MKGKVEAFFTKVVNSFPKKRKTFPTPYRFRCEINIVFKREHAGTRFEEVMEVSKTMNNFFTGMSLQIISGAILSPSTGDFGQEGYRPIKWKGFGRLRKTGWSG
jgi:hypothetical protein